METVTEATKLQGLFGSAKLTLGRVLGSGVSSQVCLATSQDDTEKRYAVKVMNISNADFQAMYSTELDILKDLRHHYIVQFEFGVNDDQNGLLVFGYCPGGCLGAKLGQVNDAVVLLRYTLQVASALEYLHGQRIYHRDVKPDNILLNQDDQAMLADFGISGRLEDATDRLLRWDSTPTFIGPETRSGEPMSPFKVRYLLFISSHKYVYNPFPMTFANVWPEHRDVL